MPTPKFWLPTPHGSDRRVVDIFPPPTLSHSRSRGSPTPASTLRKGVPASPLQESVPLPNPCPEHGSTSHQDALRGTGSMAMSTVWWSMPRKTHSLAHRLHRGGASLRKRWDHRLPDNLPPLPLPRARSLPGPTTRRSFLPDKAILHQRVSSGPTRHFRQMTCGKWRNLHRDRPRSRCCESTIPIP